MSFQKLQLEPWRPEFPERTPQPVRMHYDDDDEFSTLVTDRRVGIQTTQDSLENPIVFWIDEEHVYCRANWANWFPVSISDPDHFRQLGRTRQCTLHQVRLAAHDSQECQVRVCHVAALPDKLFAPEEQDSDDSEYDKFGERLRKAAIRRLASEIDCVGVDDVLMGFQYTELPDVPTLDLIASSDRKAVLFAVHPPETDPGFATGVDFEPEEDDPRFDPIFFNETIQRLVRQREALLKFDGDTEVVLAVYDYPFMLKRIKNIWQEELDAAGIALTWEMDFDSFLRKQFGGEDGDTQAPPAPTTK